MKDCGAANQTDIRDARADHDAVAAAVHFKVVRNRIKAAETHLLQWNGDRFGFSSLQIDLSEALQFFGGAIDARFLRADIKLRDFRTVPHAGIGQGEGDLLTVDPQIGIGKARVAQPKTEREPYRNMRRFKIPIADI